MPTSKDTFKFALEVPSLDPKSAAQELYRVIRKYLEKQGIYASDISLQSAITDSICIFQVTGMQFLLISNACAKTRGLIKLENLRIIRWGKLPMALSREMITSLMGWLKAESKKQH